MWKRGNFEKHVAGTLNIMLRSKAELRNSLKELGICESVGDFTSWVDGEERATGSNYLTASRL